MTHRLESQADRIAAARQLCRIKATAMTPAELDLAIALLLEKTIEYEEPLRSSPRVPDGTGGWVVFSPTAQAEAFVEVLSQLPLVTTTECQYDDAENENKVTGRYYGCHGFYTDVEATGTDLRQVVGITCAWLLAHRLEFDETWNPELT